MGASRLENVPDEAVMLIGTVMLLAERLKVLMLVTVKLEALALFARKVCTLSVLTIDETTFKLLAPTVNVLRVVKALVPSTVKFEALALLAFKFWIPAQGAINVPEVVIAPKVATGAKMLLNVPDVNELTPLTVKLEAVAVFAFRI